MPIYRVFERRLGSRRFASRLLSSMVLSTAIELSVTAAVSAYAKANDRAADFSGILAVGP